MGIAHSTVLEVMVATGEDIDIDIDIDMNVDDEGPMMLMLMLIVDAVRRRHPRRRHLA